MVSGYIVGEDGDHLWVKYIPVARIEEVLYHWWKTKKFDLDQVIPVDQESIVNHSRKFFTAHTKERTQLQYLLKDHWYTTESWFDHSGPIIIYDGDALSLWLIIKPFLDAISRFSIVSPEYRQVLIRKLQASLVTEIEELHTNAIPLPKNHPWNQEF